MKAGLRCPCTEFGMARNHPSESYGPSWGGFPVKEHHPDCPSYKR